MYRRTFKVICAARHLCDIAAETIEAVLDECGPDLHCGCQKHGPIITVEEIPNDGATEIEPHEPEEEEDNEA